jgi:hypothetical protein
VSRHTLIVTITDDGDVNIAIDCPHTTAERPWRGMAGQRA